MVKEICVFQIDRRIVTHFDFLIPILVIPIIAISYYLISEANTMLANKQLVYFSVGIAAFLPYPKLRCKITHLFLIYKVFL